MQFLGKTMEDGLISKTGMARIDASASHPLGTFLTVAADHPYFLCPEDTEGGPFAFKPDAAFTVTLWELRLPDSR